MSENSKPDFFIKIINLDRRKDRMDAMMKNIAETCFSQYPIERFSAINGIDLVEDVKKKELDSDIIWKVITALNRDSIPKGELGAFLSHYFLLKKIWRDKTIDLNQMIIIMEDDVHFSKNNYSQEIQDIKNFNKTNIFDVMYISGRFHKNFTCNDNKMYNRITPNIFERLSGKGHNWDRTLNSFIIKKISIPAIIDCLIQFLQNNGFTPVDAILVECNVKQFDIFPHLFYSPMNYSTDIQCHHIRDKIKIDNLKQFAEN